MKLEGNKIISKMGDVLAEKINGEWETKNPEVLQFAAASEKKKEEAWVVKTIKKVVKK